MISILGGLCYATIIYTCVLHVIVDIDKGFIKFSEKLFHFTSLVYKFIVLECETIVPKKLKQ